MLRHGTMGEVEQPPLLVEHSFTSWQLYPLPCQPEEKHGTRCSRVEGHAVAFDCRTVYCICLSLILCQTNTRHTLTHTPPDMDSSTTLAGRPGRRFNQDVTIFRVLRQDPKRA